MLQQLWPVFFEAWRVFVLQKQSIDDKRTGWAHFSNEIDLSRQVRYDGGHDDKEMILDDNIQQALHWEVKLVPTTSHMDEKAMLVDERLEESEDAVEMAIHFASAVGGYTEEVKTPSRTKHIQAIRYHVKHYLANVSVEHRQSTYVYIKDVTDRLDVDMKTNIDVRTALVSSAIECQRECLQFGQQVADKLEIDSADDPDELGHIASRP